jgi:TPR repeat protein
MTPPRQILASLALLVMVLSPARAGDFEDGKAAYDRGDYTTALRLWRPLGEQGDAAAQYGMGELYANGWGVPLDIPEAVAWLRKSAEQGNGAAMLALGVVHGAFGPNIAPDAVQTNIQSYMWFTLAASYFPPDDKRDQLVEMTFSGRHRDEIVEEILVNRGMVAAAMTPSQIEEAERLASEWLTAHPQ